MSKKLSILMVMSFVVTMSNQINSANIIFDMNGVLVTQKGSFWRIGPTKFFGLFNPLHLEDTLFDFLHSLAPLRKDTPRAMHKKRLLPQIICDYHMNRLTSVQVKKIVVDKLNYLETGIDSKRKFKLLRAITEFIFTPELFVTCIAPLKKGVKILKKCHRQKDKEGNRKHKIFIISNWDESFELLFENKEIKKFLDRCDGIVTSAMCGRMKPDKEIFEFAFEYFGIDPDKELTVFIDDEKTNILAARLLNKKFLKCIHCDNFDFTSVDKTLRKTGIYSKNAQASV